MAFPVHLTHDAARDLEEVCDYIDRHDSPTRANYVPERIETDRGRRNGKGKNRKYQAPVYANRTRIGSWSGAIPTCASNC